MVLQISKVNILCGIILVGSKSMSSADVDRFEKLLYCDVFRGAHSTGVFTQRQYGTYAEKQKPVVQWYKEATEAKYFLDGQGWPLLRNGDVTPAKLGNFYVGHNRYATMGSVTSKNAHPFNHGDITLVHNGTLTNQSLLPNHEKFVVDSENICHSINKIGAAETIQKLDGAFTLVWFDSSDKTLHIIRNEERPFHLAETFSGDWYGASEKDMLLWILNRGKQYLKIKQNFEIEVGVEYIFDAAPGKFSLKEKVKHELPKFTHTYSPSYWQGYGSYGSYPTYNRSSVVYTPPKASTGEKFEKVNNLFEAEGLKFKHGDQLVFSPSWCQEYKPKQGIGMIEGFLDESTAYIEVQAHSADLKNFNMYQPLSGRIIGAYKESGVLTVLVTNPTLPETLATPIETEFEEDDINDLIEEEGVVVKQLNGETYTQSKWESSNHCQCGGCNSPVSFEDADKLEWFNGEPLCDTCRDDIYSQLAEEEYAKQFQEEVDHFECTGCGKPTHNDDTGSVDGFCLSCRPLTRKITGKLVIKKKEKSSRFTRIEWAKAGRCNCGFRVAYKYSEDAVIVDGKVKCNRCVSRTV